MRQVATERRRLRLYDWNARVSAAVLRDLAHFEVALRNAYDSALTGPRLPGIPTGLLPQRRVPARIPHQARLAGGQPASADINRKPREIHRRGRARRAGGRSAPPGKVIANLTFGFWRYLSSKAHEKSLWVPYLHAAFPPKTNRSDIDARVGRLHDLRNRVAHHEPS